MRQYVIKRLLLMIPTLFGVALLVFFCCGWRLATSSS